MHQWHVQAGHSQLWLTRLPTLVGRGGHSEGYRVWGSREGGGRGVKDGENTQPSLRLSHLRLFWQTSKHRILDVNHWTSSRWIFRPPQPVELQRVSLLRAGRPIRCPCLPLRWSAWRWEPLHYNIYTQATRKTNSWPTPLTHSLLCSPPFFTLF